MNPVCKVCGKENCMLWDDRCQECTQELIRNLEIKNKQYKYVVCQCNEQEYFTLEKVHTDMSYFHSYIIYCRTNSRRPAGALAKLLNENSETVGS